MPLDLPGAHAAGVHGDDLCVEAGEAALVFGNELRVEAGQAVARDLQLELTGAGQHRTFGQRLFQVVQQPTLGQGSPRVRAAQQLIEQLIRNGRLFASRYTRSPSIASYGHDTKSQTVPPTPAFRISKSKPNASARVGRVLSSLSVERSTPTISIARSDTENSAASACSTSVLRPVRSRPVVLGNPLAKALPMPLAAR